MRRRDLSPDEAALWSEVAKSVKPIRRRQTKGSGAGGLALAEKSDAPVKARPRAKAKPEEPPSQTAPAAKATAARLPSPFESGDRRLDGKALRGRIAVERTLDLHGLTQNEAAARLLRFLENASADRVKCVRVITGKGAPGPASSDLLAPERGVLRRRFLEWVETAPYRGLIARVSSAEPGARAGAFFVFLKSRRKA